MPDAPGQLSAESVQGSVITLTWRAPDNTQPDSYVLEGGFAPDETAASLALSAESTSAQVALGPGTYFIRSYALAAGERSAASNEIRVVVGAPAPPGPPQDLAVVGLGSTVSVTWRQSSSDGAPDRVDLEVSGPVGGTFEVAGTGSFGVGGVPDGVYTVRARARNQHGVSDFSAPVTVTMPGRIPVAADPRSRNADDSRLPIRLERTTMSRLAELRSREGLDAVVAGATTEFEAVLRLKEWTARQFVHGNPDPYPPWDAVTVLDWIRGGITGGFCGQFSQVLLQALAAFDVPARYIEIGRVENPYAHYLLEFWSSDFRKWVVLDPSFNTYFERFGVPLSALEVHDIAVAEEDATVQVVEGARQPGDPRASDLPRRTLEVFYYLRYHLKANHVSVPDEHPFDRFNDMIEFRDHRVAAWEASTVVSDYPKEVLTRTVSSDRLFIDAPVSETSATSWISAPGQVTVHISTSFPAVAAAEYRVVDADGAAGSWTRHYSPTLVWNVSPQDRALEVRPVNVQGVGGPTASVVLVTP